MQIIYFPYLHLGELEEINFDGIKVWNFERKSADYIPDGTLREHIKNILYTNIAHNQSIKDIGVLSIGAIDFREFSKKELEIAREVRLLFFLTFLSKYNTLERGANTGWYLCTAENFEFVIQNFQLETDHIAEESGYIVPILSGGYKIGEKKFYKPSYVLKPLRFSLDALLLIQLLKLRKTGGKKLYRRILQATDLFFESYYNNPHLSRNARVLLQIAAFETLLQLPQRDQRKDFKDKIEKYCNLLGEKLYKHYYETLSGKRPEFRSKKAIWADIYYTLRNHIIHGSKVKPNDFAFKNVQRHIDIATLFFVLLVKKLINEKRPKKQIFFDEIKWGKTKDRDTDDTFEGFIYIDNDLTRRLSRALSSRKIRVRKQTKQT